MHLHGKIQINSKQRFSLVDYTTVDILGKSLRESERVFRHPDRLSRSKEGGKRRHTTRRSSALIPVHAKFKHCSLEKINTNQLNFH